jgi:hypothetical protein
LVGDPGNGVDGHATYDEWYDAKTPLEGTRCVELVESLRERSGAEEPGRIQKLDEALRLYVEAATGAGAPG